MSSQPIKTSSYYKLYSFMPHESNIGYAPAVSGIDMSSSMGAMDKARPLINFHEAERSKLFFDRIGRPDLKEEITSRKPWLYCTLELYTEYIKGQGGLGMLASDTLKTAKQLGVPMIVLTPFYPEERSYEIEGFTQKEVRKKVIPQERGFEKRGETSISTLVHSAVPLFIYVRQEGSVAVVTVTEPNFGELYQGENNSDHRMYQAVALGFGGHKALRELGITPSMNQQLNEAPTVFSALARLDEHISIVGNFKQALADIKKNTIYTNHTLEQAAEPEFTLRQFEHFVMPNIRSEEIKNWLRKKIQGKEGRIKLSTLAIELSDKRNGVSRIHAREASKRYKDYDGNNVNFEAVTNGISLERWTNSKLLGIYRKEGVLDAFDLPADDYQDRLESMDGQKLKAIKEKRKRRLQEFLLERKDQYGNSIKIPKESKIFNWRRRLAGYKRPGMLFADPQKLAEILKEKDIHLVMAGNVHPSDGEMRGELERILTIIDRNSVLRERVHFVQNYDEELAHALVEGADVSINTPKVMDETTGEKISTEACGTSPYKDMVNNTILISTDDGGVADPTMEAEEKGAKDFMPNYLQIKGKTYQEEVVSLYSQMERAADIIEGKDAEFSWDQFVKRQLAAYLPIISGSRMETDYINLGFPISKN